MTFRIVLSFFLLSWISCNTGEKNASVATASVGAPTVGEFTDYWYKGEAEISSFDLEQRYSGEMLQGDAVLVFVTEPFSKSKQVKLDYAEEEGQDNVSVLKLNYIRKFNTGLYDYSMMTSVFTPIEVQQFPHSLKTTTSVQEWQGHTFTQLNLDDRKYDMKQFSYFEAEGDTQKKLDAVLLEDEIWNRIRINPTSVPIGEVEIIPGTFFIRFTHEKIRPTKARISVEEIGATSELKIEYLHYPRTLIINYETQFPYRILSWTEDDGRGTLTSATRKQSIKNAYWTKNSSEFVNLRDTLQLLK